MLSAVRRSRFNPVPLDTPEAASIWRRFRHVVNMTPAQIRVWLETAESKKVGFTHEGERESRGRQSARRIIAILENGGPKTPDDVAHMKDVIGYVKRHSRQRPRGSVRYTPWRYSMMNWARDPLGRGSL